MLNVPLVFLDTETTGLSYDKQVWDVAMIRDNPDGTTERDQFMIQVFEESTELYEFNEDSKQYNHWERYDAASTISALAAAEHIKHMFRDNAHLVGMVPDFDSNALWRLIRDHSADSRAGFPWYYQVIDVDMIALGYFRGCLNGLAGLNNPAAKMNKHTLERLVSLPLNTNAASAYLGVPVPSDSERHTAMGDAKWTRNIYYALAGVTPPA